MLKIYNRENYGYRNYHTGSPLMQQHPPFVVPRVDESIAMCGVIFTVKHVLHVYAPQNYEVIIFVEPK